MVAREPVDIGEPRRRSPRRRRRAGLLSAKVDAAFHAGWIALRFLGRAEEAAKRFDVADSVAATPLSIARASYRRGAPPRRSARRTNATFL